MSVFLQAEWRKLAMANYRVDPSLLAPYLPSGTVLDFWKDACYVSLVGFMFLNTRVLGLKIPYHINFEEVNLRFYVTHADGGVSKRGVVFIKEIVPRSALTFVANTVYGENYETMPMGHAWISSDDQLRVEYRWKKKRWNTFQVITEPAPVEIADGSEEEFITEHYWGYTKHQNRTSEYGVEHPRWLVYPTKSFSIDVDFGAVYGKQFDFLQNQKPESVFLAEGSAISVLQGRRI